MRLRFQPPVSVGPRHRLSPALLVMVGALLSGPSLVGCAGDTARAVDPERDLHDPNPGRRMRAIAAARASKDPRHLERLVDLLEDTDPGVRAFAIQTLEELTGRQTDYKAYAGPDERRAGAVAWRAWLASRGAPAPGGGDR